MCAAVKETAAESCATMCKEQQEAAALKLTEADTDGEAKLKVLYLSRNLYKECKGDWQGDS